MGGGSMSIRRVQSDKVPATVHFAADAGLYVS